MLSGEASSTIIISQSRELGKGVLVGELEAGKEKGKKILFCKCVVEEPYNDGEVFPLVVSWKDDGIFGFGGHPWG